MSLFPSFSADGSRLAWAGQGNVHVWDVDAAREIRTIGDPGGDVGPVALSADGGRLAAAVGPTFVFDEMKVWDMADGRELMDAKSQRSVQDLTFSRDGCRLASFRWQNDAEGDHGGVTIWDAAAGLPVLRLGVPAGYVRRPAAVPARRRAAVSVQPVPAGQGRRLRGLGRDADGGRKVSGHACVWPPAKIRGMMRYPARFGSRECPVPTHHDVRCPACQKKVRLAAGFLGKRVACPYCKQIFLPTASEAKVPGAAAPDPSAETLRGQIARLEADLAQARATGDRRPGAPAKRPPAWRSSCGRPRRRPPDCGTSSPPARRPAARRRTSWKRCEPSGTPWSISARRKAHVERLRADKELRDRTGLKGAGACARKTADSLLVARELRRPPRRGRVDAGQSLPARPGELAKAKQ